MNTSFPSAASDFGAFLAGGNQPNNNSQLKGILAGLGCAKPATVGSASAAKKDFDEILDAPATPPPTSAASNTAEAAPSMLTGERSAVVTTTLQIRGMVGGRCHPAPLGSETAPSEDGEAAPSMKGQGETQPDSQTVDTGSIGPTTVNAAAPVTTEPEVTDETGPKTAATPGPVVPRQIKLLPGRGHSMRGRGWNPALIQHTGICGKSAQPAKIETPVVKAALPAVSCSSPAANPGTAVAPDVIVAAIAGIVAPTELQPVVPATDDRSIESSADLSNEAGIDNPVAPRLSEPTAIVPVVVESNLSEVAPTHDLSGSVPIDLTPILPKDIAAEAPVLPVEGSTRAPVSPVVQGEATVAEVAVNDIFAPVLDRVEETAAVAPDALVQTEVAPIAPELRREVVETVAAMLAPFLTNLPLIQPELTPVASNGLATDSVGTEGGNTAPVNATVTIKIGAQPPFAFELPQESLTQTGAADTGTDDLAATLPASEKSDDVAASESNPGSFVLPAGLSRLAEEIQPPDFRIQLKAKIEAAWPQPAQPETDVAETVRQIPAVDEMSKADVSLVEGEAASVAHPAIVSEKVETDETGKPVVAVAAPPADAREQSSKAETLSTPVEVMIKMPGFGVLTAQLMTSDKAASALPKKPGIGLARAEKTAGDKKSDAIKIGGENSDFEKTFLNPGTQSVKSKVGNAGTTVAISDDTMPARFTSRRVTVDQLEFPSRFNAREIQPIFNASQNFPVANETPVATTPAPVLAHRAVETILNVVEAQRESSANASSVNLHFKFGGDDLAVRVQMRGGEVLTQFLTDSAELRSALSNEWQTVAAQGGAAGLRMQDPIIMPTSAGTSHGFGSMAQGQNQARQQAQQQQQEHAASVMPEFHTFRRGSTTVTSPTEAAPRVSFAPSTSQHLTATA